MKCPDHAGKPSFDLFWLAVGNDSLQMAQQASMGWGCHSLFASDVSVAAEMMLWNFHKCVRIGQLCAQRCQDLALSREGKGSCMVPNEQTTLGSSHPFRVKQKWAKKDAPQNTPDQQCQQFHGTHATLPCGLTAVGMLSESGAIWFIQMPPSP